ncbi:MAG: PAS domain S-box protein [Deltaproteobacteria bacterium]|nr:PAS domain S-box protein [Deltaproteobacteria bacterium]
MEEIKEQKTRTKIVVVDDELQVLDSIHRVLDGELYEVLTATSAAEAFSLLDPSPAAVIIADYRMPGMNGVQFLKEVLKKWPDTIRIILSGYADIQSVVDAINEGQIYKFITKPWDNLELQITIANAVDRYEMSRKNKQLMDDLRQLVDKHEHAEQLYKNLTEQSFAGVYVVQDGVFKLINDNAASYAGYTAAELRGKPSNIMLVHPDDREDHARKSSEMLKGKRKDPYRFRILTKDGQIRWIMETLVSIQYDGHPAILGNSMDITSQKQMEEQLVSTLNQLEKAYGDLASVQAKIIQQQKMASIGQLSAGIAHEINNPMGFILGNLGVLEIYARNIESIINIQRDFLSYSSTPERLKDVESEWKRLKIDRILGDIHKLIRESVAGADRIKKIVADLMRFSMSDELEHKPDDINAGLLSVLSMLKNDILKEATLIEDWGQLPLTRCNIGQLSQAFMGIMKNAAQAVGRKGEIRVATRQENNLIVVSISDTGVGIPDDLKERIFEPFFTTREVGQGMGLGLSTAYDIIKKHNGEITLESAVGKGSTFTIRIPVVR